MSLSAEPTEAQKEAGNYAKHHISVHGLPITIENRKGSKRSGIGKDGKRWSVTMPADYGYFKRSEGADGDHVDCYLGMAHKSRFVLVIDQKDADTGRFDEHKCMLGFTSKKQALDFYKRGFSDGKGEQRIGHTTEMDIDEFKDWLKNGDTTERLGRKDGGAVHLAEGGTAEQPTLDAIFNAPPSLDQIFSEKDVGIGSAAATGIEKGLFYNTADEIAGLRAASNQSPDLPKSPLIGLAKLGAEALMGKGNAAEEYEKGKATRLKEEETASKQHPYATGTGELAGSAIAPAFLKAPAVGASVGELAGWGAKTGALTGMLSGAGEGEGFTDRLAKSTTSGLLGAGTGAIAAPIIGKAMQGAGNLINRATGRVAEEVVPPPIDPNADAVTKITEALRQAKPLEREQAAIYHDIRSGQAGNLARIGQEVPGEAGFRAQLGSLRGELPKVEFESIRPHLTQSNIDDLFMRVENSDLQPFQRINAKTGLAKLLGVEGGAVPTKSELVLLQKVFPQDFVDAALQNRSFMRAAFEELGDAVNIPRSIMASFDLSAPLRQGWGMFGRQKQFAPAYRDMFKYLASDDAYKGMQAELRGRATFPVMEKSGLAIMDTHAVSPTLHEEHFMSNLAHGIPVIGKGVEASDRAYTGFLTKLRADVFDDIYAKAQRMGVADRPGLVEDLAEYINTFTGRGTLSYKRASEADWSRTALEKAGPLLNGIFFSPRLIASRTQMLNPQFYYKLDPFVRKEALRDLLSSSSTAASVIGLAGLAGADVVLDPRNADFAKIKVGNTRYDITGGIQPYLRLGAQLATGQVVSSTSGRTMTLGEGYKPMTRWDALARFFESKEAPIASFIHSSMKGQGFTGRDFNTQAEVIKRVTPMMLQDLWELNQEYGPSGLPMGIPGMFGVGSQTYGKVQFEEGKNKAGLPAAQIGPPPDWGEYAATNASRPWKTAFGEGESPKGSSKRFDIEQFMRNNYNKMSPEEKSAFNRTVGRSYPSLEKKIDKVRNEMAQGITANELDMKARAVEDGTRALAIKKELEALPTYDQKIKHLNRYRKINAVNDDVERQLRSLGAIPKIDPTNTIKPKDQEEIGKALGSVPRRYGGRVFQKGGLIRFGTGQYTPEEIEASRKEHDKFREAMARMSARLAPRGIPWESWRRSRNVEDRTDEEKVPERERIRRRWPSSYPDAPVTPLSQEAGFDDIGKKRGGKIKRVRPTVTIPETAATLRKQQQSLIAGHRKAMLFPHKSSELALPRGMSRMKTRDGLIHFDRKKLMPSQIRKASDEGRMNDILGMGPVSKEDALARASTGEKPIAVVERGPDGTEAKAVLGTESTAPEQIAALEDSADPGDMVGVEPVQDTLMHRMAIS